MRKGNKLIVRSIALTKPQWNHLKTKAQKAGSTVTAIIRGWVLQDIEVTK